MSTTIAAVGGTAGSGLATERHAVWAVNSARVWMFAFTAANVLSSWWSTDGVSWTAGATHTLTTGIINQDGRRLSVAYKNIAARDVIHDGWSWIDASNHIKSSVVRATISGSAITFHTADTVVQPQSTTVDATFLASSLEFDSTNRVYFASPANWSTATFAEDINNARSTVDPGTAEQATAPTWTLQNVDSSPTSINDSMYLVPLASGNMGLLADNGASATGTTAILWFTWNGTTWSASTSATGVIASIDKNDWGAVAKSTSDVHLVYRSGANTYVHRRWNGTSWAAGSSVPTQTSKAGAGVALASDGTSVWALVIDSDSANTVRYCKWDGANWGSWTALESTTATRTFIGSTKDVLNGAIISYWTEGSNLVATKLALSSAQTLSPTTATLLVASAAPTWATAGSSLAPVTAGSVLATRTPTFVASATLSPSAVGASLASQAPTLLGTATLTPSPGAAAVASQAPSWATGSILSPASASVVLALQAPILAFPATLTPTADTVVVAIQSPSWTTNSSISPASGAAGLSAHVPAWLSSSAVLGPSGSTLVLATAAPSWVGGPGSLAVASLSVVIAASGMSWPGAAPPQTLSPASVGLVIVAIAPTWSGASVIGPSASPTSLALVPPSWTAGVATLGPSALSLLLSPRSLTWFSGIVGAPGHSPTQVAVLTGGHRLSVLTGGHRLALVTDRNKVAVLTGGNNLKVLS